MDAYAFTHDVPTLVTSYDQRLVALSVAIAVLSSYAALDLAGRVTATRGRLRLAWLIGGAGAMGTGIWCMHFSGMLAQHLPVPVAYHIPTVIASLVAAAFAAFVALLVVSRERATVAGTVTGGLLMGLGIATMHYTGMAAMRMPAMHHYNRPLFALSVVLAIVISFVALWLTSAFRKDNRGLWAKIGISTVMGLAIPVMHYTGMAAVSYTPMAMPLNLRYSIGIDSLAHPTIILTTLAMLLAVLLTSLVDRRFSLHRDEIELSRKLFGHIIHRAPDPIFIFDRETMAVFVINSSAVKTFGVSDPSAQNLKIGDILPIEKMEEYPLGRELQHVRADGTLFDAELRFVPMDWKSGPAIMIIALDTTQRKALERERDTMEVQLRHAQKLESIGQLAAGIAHEINTPMQYVGDNAHFLNDAFRDLEPLLKHCKEVLAAAAEDALTPEILARARALASEVDSEYLMEEIPRAIQQTQEGVQRVATLVSAMKEFSHPGAKGRVPVNLNRAIESTVTVARHEWKYVAEVVTEFDTTLPLVPCLPDEFNQVVLNLIVNAAHAIGDVVGDGGRGKGTITVRTRHDDRFAEVQVEDTGSGIPKSAQARIFDPFFTTKEVGKGTGQGLAIAHTAIVKKHGGTISFVTEEGKGTIFTIRLPLEGAVIAAIAGGVVAA